MSEKYNKEDFFNNAPINTRVRNSETGIFYIKTKKGWQKDDSGASRIGRWWETDAEEDAFYSGTIGKDGRFYLGKGRGFTITDDHPLAEKFRTEEQNRVQLRIDAPAKKAEKQRLNQYNALIKNQKESIKFYEEQYPHLKGKLENIFKKAHASGNPKEYLLKNHNLQIGQSSEPGWSTQFSKPTPTGKISSFYFDSLDKIQKLEKTLNINQPKPIEYKKPELKPTYSQNNQDKGRVVSDTNLSNTLKVNPGDQIAMANTSKSNNSNKIKSNDKVQQHRFSWEKDLDSKDAKKLQDIRNVFGDYRNELNASKKAKGSKANRKKLTGPMNQHTAEMLGLL